MAEWSQFTVAGNPKVTTLCFPSYTSSHKTNYTVARLNQIPVDTLMDRPEKQVSSGEVVRVHLATGGGLAMNLEWQEK